MELFRLCITACITPLLDQLFSEFEDAFVVIWPVYEVFEVPAASCGRQLIVYLERNRDEQGQHAIRTRKILREIAMTPTSGGIILFYSACSGFADYYLGGNYSKLSITVY